MMEKEVSVSKWLFVLFLKLVKKMTLVNFKLRVPFSVMSFFKVSDSLLPALDKGCFLACLQNLVLFHLKNGTFLVLVLLSWIMLLLCPFTPPLFLSKSNTTHHLLIMDLNLSLKLRTDVI